VKGLHGISAQVLSDTIGEIYDCALDPEHWQTTIGRIVELCDSSGGGMCVHDVKNSQNDRLFEIGYDPEFSKLLSARIGESTYIASAMIASVGDVLTLASTCSDQELIESRFYQEVLKPYGYFDFIAIMALRTDARFASLHASLDQVPRYNNEHEISLFKLLSPHICRTLAISDALDIRTLRSEMLEATLDGLAAGVYLVTRDGRVVYMNAAAEKQVKTGNAIRIVNNRLSPIDPHARDALTKAIDEVAKDETEAGAGSHALAVPDASGSGYVATLLPVERGRRQNVIAPFAASVAVFVQEPAQVTLMPGEAFARLYRLTGGELRVLSALAQGLGGKEAADMLGIGEPTVRTHLQHIFSKTGTSRQADLLRLLQSAVPPTAAA
jgi:DNA-binding CsgD family transcriptional regulator/PAS domain-containing protein